MTEVKAGHDRDWRAPVSAQLPAGRRTAFTVGVR